MKLSPILCASMLAMAAFASSADRVLADQYNVSPNVKALKVSDVTLSDRVNALQAQVNQLTAQVQKLEAQLAQTTKTANDANFKAALAMNWINANGDKLLKATNLPKSGAVDGNPPVPSTDDSNKSSVDTSPQMGSTTTLCNVADVHSYPDRIHIRCKQPASGGIYYFASESNTTVAVGLQVANSIGVGGLTNKTVSITYNPNQSANPAGCLTNDCRRLLGVK